MSIIYKKDLRDGDLVFRKDYPGCTYIVEDNQRRIKLIEGSKGQVLSAYGNDLKFRHDRWSIIGIKRGTRFLPTPQSVYVTKSDLLNGDRIILVSGEEGVKKSSFIVNKRLASYYKNDLSRVDSIDRNNVHAIIRNGRIMFPLWWKPKLSHEDLEPKTHIPSDKIFYKKDLVAGDKVILRDKSIREFDGEHFNGYIYLPCFTVSDDLCNLGYVGSDWDIVKVIRDGVEYNTPQTSQGESVTAEDPITKTLTEKDNDIHTTTSSLKEPTMKIVTKNREFTVNPLNVLHALTIKPSVYLCKKFHYLVTDPAWKTGKFAVKYGRFTVPFAIAAACLAPEKSCELVSRTLEFVSNIFV